MFCAAAQHCIIHHTVHNKVNHSTAASQRRTPAKLPAVPGLPAGQTCWRARWASPVLRTCLIGTTQYGRSRNQILPNCRHGCPCCTRRGIAKPARTVTLSQRPSKQSWVCCAAGSGCILLRLGMRVWQTVCTFVRTQARACVRVCHGVCVQINRSIARSLSLSLFLSFSLSFHLSFSPLFSCCL